MKKVILLVLYLPALAFGQVIETFKSGNIKNLLRSETGDIVITEIMADPSRSILPGEEYLEIYNRSQYTCNLKGWKTHNR